MDNRQLRTAMVSRLIGKNPIESIFPDSTEEILSLISEMASNVTEWRKSVEGLTMSIAARGGSDGCWYIDLIANFQTGFKELLARSDDALASYAFAKLPQKALFFTPDAMTTMYSLKHEHPETEIHFVNTQSLYNYETFARDSSVVGGPDSYRDIDYSVVERDEIGSGDASGYDFIQVAAWDAVYDLEILNKCVDALSSNGVLYVMSTNHSGKIYRDDAKMHPYYGAHELLNSKDGYTYHNSDTYGFTVFTKK
jgi:hypothetical protein